MDRDKELFQEKMRILVRAIKSGKLHFPEGKGFEKPFLEIRQSPDGTVDPNSVDGRVMAVANLLFRQEMEKDMRKTPLSEVHFKYIEILEKHFSKPYSEMKKHNVSPEDIAADLATNKKAIRSFIDSNFGEALVKFWMYYGPIVEVHVEDLKSAKAVYGGSTFPLVEENLVSRSGLYFDTILLPDPLLRTATLVNTAFKPEAAFFYFVKYALNVLTYKDFLLAEVHPPIAVIVPDMIYVMEEKLDYLRDVSSMDLMSHVGSIFHKKFSEETELENFLSQIGEKEQFEPLIQSKEKVLVDLDSNDLTLKGRLNDIEKGYEDYVEIEEDTPFWWKFKNVFFGRMMQANHVMLRSELYSGTPVLDAPTSWQYLVWKLQGINEDSKKYLGDYKDLFISKSLVNSLSDNIPFLGNVPPGVIIKLREEGALSELRGIISKSINDINEIDEDNFEKVEEQILLNLTSAFVAHGQEVKKLEETRSKFYGYDIGAWLAKVGISVAATLKSDVPISLALLPIGFFEAFPTNNVQELWKKGKKILSEENKLKRTPMGILFETLK